MKTIIANWKNHPETLEKAKELFEFEVTEAIKYPNLKTVICPPEQFLRPLAEINKKFIGAQDVFWNLGGDGYGGKYALVGHSDRRRAGDTDEAVNQKLKIALESGVTPVFLMGEKEKTDNRQVILQKQLTVGLATLSTSDVDKVLIVYEPVWAISTNPNAEPDTPEDTLKAMEIINTFLLKTYNLKPKTILYGGSITEKNVADFLKHQEIGGAVIGGASLRKEEFARILEIASQIK